MSTLRYYEREGLLEPESRTASGYRLFGPQSVERVRFIRAAQSVGFTLGDIRVLLEMQAGDHARCGRVRPVIEERLGHVEERLLELRRFRDSLERFLEICRRREDDDACPVVDELDPHESSDGSPEAPDGRGAEAPRGGAGGGAREA